MQDEAWSVWRRELTSLYWSWWLCNSDPCSGQERITWIFRGVAAGRRAGEMRKGHDAQISIYNVSPLEQRESRAVFTITSRVPQHFLSSFTTSPRKMAWSDVDDHEQTVKLTSSDTLWKIYHASTSPTSKTLSLFQLEVGIRWANTKYESFLFLFLFRIVHGIGYMGWIFAWTQYPAMYGFVFGQ